MISEQFYQEEMDIPMIKTKTKRDEFLVEIRKKKSQMILLKKRIKLYGSENDQPNGDMQEELYNNANSQIDVQEIFPISLEVTLTFINY